MRIIVALSTYLVFVPDANCQSKAEEEFLLRLGTQLEKSDDNDVYVKMDISSPLLGDTELQIVGKYKLLETLSLTHTKITGRGFIHLRELSGLRYLILKENSLFDGTGFALLKGKVNKIQSLVIRQCPITDDGLKAITTLSGLLSITLTGTQITDKGLSHLVELNRLEHLVLSGAKVTNQGVKKVCRLPGLKSLFLRETLIDDDCLPDILEIKHLSWLNVAHTKVSDASICHIVKMQKLTVLDIRGSRITPSGATTIRERLPKLLVVYED